MQRLGKILEDLKTEGHPLRTLRRKIYTNTLGTRPERAVYKSFLKPLILNVGCGRDYISGAVNIDNLQLHTYTDFKTNPDVCLDACEAWPETWRGSFKTVLASHLWEHLPHPEKFFDNAYKVLSIGGHLILVVPNYLYMGDRAYFRDPTHLWRCPGALTRVLASEGGRWEVVQLNKLGKRYKFSFDLVLKKL